MIQLLRRVGPESNIKYFLTLGLDIGAALVPYPIAFNLYAQISPSVNLNANPTPGVNLLANPSPTVEVKTS